MDTEKKQSIIICEYISTGINYVDDALARGYKPVLVEGHYIGSPEDVERFKEIRERINRRMKSKVDIIPESLGYEEILRQVKEHNPAVVVAGSEFGVPLAARLAADLGLQGNPVDRIPQMTEKEEMHKALKEYGIRYIEGRSVTSEEEAREYYRELGMEDVVVKPSRGAGSQGVYICHGEEELTAAVRRHFAQTDGDGNPVKSVLIQERIKGTEYVVNTASCNGKHRVVSVGMYDKYRLSNNSIAYNYFRYLTKIDVGHSALLKYACDVADAVGIKYGPVHGEYMVDDRGPVLIEINCRPMGGGLERKYSEMITGQHETDSALDSYLDPDKFFLESLRPYRPKRCGISKDIVLIKDTEVLSAPVLQICRRLKSYYSASYNQIGMTDLMLQTTDLETEAGLIYLIHDNEQQVKDDCDLLHLLETKYPEILFQVSDADEEWEESFCDVESVMKDANCHGATLVFSDSKEKVNDAAVVGSRTLSAAYDSYEFGILDLTQKESFADLESIIQQIFTFMDKIRPGGRIVVPKSTYCHLPYGIEGMEILFKVSGMLIELPPVNSSNLLIATIQ